MSNPDLLNEADRILRPVLRKFAAIEWLKVNACCAGHQPEDSVWFELHVAGTTGFWRLVDFLRILDGKLAGTDCRTDCLVNYGGETPVPHGWYPLTVEAFWPAGDDWRRGQALIIEAFLSSVEEFGNAGPAEHSPEGAINYCPFCASSFVRLETLDAAGCRYRCGDCETTWTMIDPAV